MILTRHGKCWGCKRKVEEPKEFLVPVDMFNPDRRWLDIPEVVAQVQAWRYGPLWCGPDVCVASRSDVRLEHTNSNERSE